MMLKILVGSTLGFAGKVARFVKIEARFQIAVLALLLLSPTLPSTNLALATKNSPALDTLFSDNN
jgi:hypothetical protein